MGFFDKINNSTIVDTFKQFLWHIFHGYPANLYIPQKYTFCQWKSTKTTLAGHHQTSTSSDYWREVLYVIPATQPSVSKHWREHKALTLTSSLEPSFLQPQPDSWRKGHFCLYAASQTSVAVPYCFGREPPGIIGKGFYWSDALPVTQPLVSKHWRKLKRANNWNFSLK